MLKRTLSKPLVVTAEQINMIQVFIKETEDGIETMPLEDYLALKITDKLLTLMSRGELDVGRYSSKGCFSPHTGQTLYFPSMIIHLYSLK